MRRTIIMQMCRVMIICATITFLPEAVIAGVNAYTWDYYGESGGVAVANGYAWCYKICEGGCEICGTSRWMDGDDWGWLQSSIYSTVVNADKNWKGDYREEAVPTGLLAIPQELDGLPVVKIGAYALVYRSKITAIEMPNTVKAIGRGAFYGCTMLENIVLPDGITTIGSEAFQGCSGLRTLTLPGKLSTIQNNAFHGCLSLPSVSFPAGLQVVGYEAFRKCSKISSLVFPDGMKAIYGRAFAECHGLESICIPATVTTIENDAFSACVGKPISVTAPFFPERVYGGTYFYYSGDDDTSAGYQWVPYGDDYSSWYDEDCVSQVSHTRIGNLTLISPIVYENLLSAAHNNPSSYVEGSVLEFLPPTGVVTGCTFSGWVPSGVTAATTGKVSTRAVWTTNDYSVVYHSNGGCGVMSNQQFVYGVAEQLEANLFTRDGYAFAGWGRKNDEGVSFSDCSVVSNLTAEANGVFDLYAIWEKSSIADNVTLTVTNIVIHYIVNSVVPTKSYPAAYDTGFVNVITEVKSGGAVSVPATWMVNYPSYVTKFGADFTKSLMKLTGKRDGAGNAMCVWQDYVAGTDPTDEDDVFTASVTMVDGQPVISYTPELNDAEKALRVYKTWGKVKLQDANWVEVPDGHNADYNFFKVTVEMK